MIRWGRARGIGGDGSEIGTFWKDEGGSLGGCTRGTQVESREGLAWLLHFPTGYIFLEQMNAEAHIRKLEDSLAEANAKVAELERNQAEINAIRTRLQGEHASPCSFPRNSV